VAAPQASAAPRVPEALEVVEEVTEGPEVRVVEASEGRGAPEAPWLLALAGPAALPRLALAAPAALPQRAQGEQADRAAAVVLGRRRPVRRR
jgi:hypothetical protein